MLESLTAASKATLSALENASTRRVQLAFLIAFTVDSAMLVLLAVTAFTAAGPVGVAAVGVARVGTSLAFGFLSATPLARWRADRLLLAIGIVRGMASAGAIVVIAVGGDLIGLVIVAAVTGATVAILAPAQSMLLPALARTPEELVTANVASSAAEAMGTFIGPLMAALFIAMGTPAFVAATAIVVQIVGIAALREIHFEDQAYARGPSRPSAGRGLGLGSGIQAIRRRPVIAIVIVAFGLQTMVRGLLTTLVVVLSVNLIHLGEAGVGLLGAAMGVGGIGGILVGLALRRSGPSAFALSLAGWGLPIAVIGLVPLPVVAVLAFVVTGVSNALLDVVGLTMLQRGCRNEQRGAVFALFEGAASLFAIIGYLLAPTLIALIGVQGAFVVTGAVLPVAAAIIWLLLRRYPEIEAVPWPLVERLRGVPAFRVLPLTGIERLLAAAEPVSFDAGDVLMAKGAPGDTFLVIDSGEAAVTDGERSLGIVGPGAGIGEIALLRGGIRTATVTALTKVHAQSFDAGSFLAAVSGPAAMEATSVILLERLARSAEVA